MVISILPHKGEAALADSSIQYVGFFEPTGFSRWWFSFNIAGSASLFGFLSSLLLFLSFGGKGDL